MNPSILDVATYILEEEGEMSTMKLQKLCYFSQGWALAWTGEPLFPDDFQAWANGPVCRTLYAQHKGMYSISTLGLGTSENVGTRDEAILKSVLSEYSGMSGLQLSELTHMGFPWLSVRQDGNLGPGDRSSALIDKSSMRAYFTSLQRA